MGMEYALSQNEYLLDFHILDMDDEFVPNTFQRVDNWNSEVIRHPLPEGNIFFALGWKTFYSDWLGFVGFAITRQISYSEHDWSITG